MECTKCPLSETRKNMVLPRGSNNPRVVFIGEASGREEDEQGKPFIGRSGKLLDKWIEQLGLKKEDYSITNIVWCRPPNNRDPTPREISTCTASNLSSYLDTIKPSFIIPLGKVASEFVLGIKINSMSYWVAEPVTGKNKFITIPMYHPAYLLRTHINVDHLLSKIRDVFTGHW